MSTAVVLSLPAHGHINPTLPLVAELVRRGDKVVFYASPPFRSAVEATGATFRSYGARYTLDASDPRGGPFGLMARSIAASAALLPELLPELRAAAPRYLLIDSMCVWGQLIQQLLDLPAVSSCTTFAMSQRVFREMVRVGVPRPPLRDVAMGLPLLLRYLRDARRLDRRYGTRTPGMLDFFINRQALNLVYTSRDFQPLGATFDASYRFVGPSIGPRHDVPDFPWERLGDGTLVFVSMGTIFNDRAAFFRACVTALRDLPCVVVIAIGDKVRPSTLGPLPEHMVVAPYVPQLALLERAALFVTHGGMNSVSEALVHGVPMLVVPQVGDQFLVASRVRQFGAGLHLTATQASPQRIRQHVLHILNDSGFAQRAAQLGASLKAAGGYRRAADDLQSWATHIQAHTGGSAESRAVRDH